MGIATTWFTRVDVEKHHSALDLYVSAMGRVFDLTELITQHDIALARVAKHPNPLEEML